LFLPLASLTAVSTKDSSLGEFSEFVPNHFFGDEHLIEHFSIMDEERMPNEFRHDRAGARPSFDRLFFAEGFQFLDLPIQSQRNERTLLN